MACAIYALCDRTRRRLGRRMPIARPVAKHLVGDVQWLAPDPALMAEMRRMSRLLFASVGVVPITFLVGVWVRDPQRAAALLAGTGGLVLLGVGLLVALLAVGVVQYALRPGRSLLGTCGRHLCLGHSKQGVYVVSPEEVVYSTSAFAYGPVTIPLRGPSRRRLPQLLYAREAFERDMQPLLARATKVSEMDLFVYQLLHRQSGAMATAGVAILGPVLFVMMLALLPR